MREKRYMMKQKSLNHQLKLLKLSLEKGNLIRLKGLKKKASEKI